MTNPEFGIKRLDVVNKASIAYSYLTCPITPVNSRRACYELLETLELAGTNSLNIPSARDSPQAKALVLFLVNQIWGDLATVDTFREYETLLKDVETGVD